MVVEPDLSNHSFGSAVAESIATEIGHIVITQSSIEFELRSMIARLSGFDYDTIETATVEMSYRQLMAMLSSLMIKRVEKDSEEYEDFVYLTNRLDEFEAFRNSIAHSLWTHSLIDLALKNQASRHKSTAKRGQGLRTTIVEMTDVELAVPRKKAVWYMIQLFTLVKRVAERP